MTFRDASEAIERIAESGVKSPFTFWVLLAVTALGLIMAGGSFWLLKLQLGASQARYDRLFTVMELSAKSDREREGLMIEELRITRTEFSNNLQDVVGMLMEQAPKKADEQARAAAMTLLKQDSDTIKSSAESIRKLEQRQDKILLSLEQIRLYIDGKSGR